MNERLLLCTLLLVATVSAQALPAFPGAEGGGAQSIGGRGGIVCEVTNLNDSGPGSFRNCVEQMSGPRTVVFRVSGNIQTLSRIVVFYPYLTIAGQTAPGGGIVLSAKNHTSPIMQINADNVIIRYLRFRRGRHITGNNGGSNLVIAKGTNLVIDHCTFTWAQDRHLASNGTPPPYAPRNITVSNNIFAEMLNVPDATGIFIMGQNNGTADVMTDIDFHHNLFSTNSHRFPLVKNKSIRIISNIMYNWRYYATHTSGGVHADIISNKYKIGPLYGTGSSNPWNYEILISPAYTINSASGNPSIYVQGNVGPNNSNPNSDSWSMVREVKSENASEVGPLSAKYKRLNPLPALPTPITIHPADQLESLLLPIVGASRRLNCLGNWVTNRDAADARIISDYVAGKGRMPANENEVGGFPSLAAGTPCTDTDRDGIPDAWEDANGLEKNNPADARSIHSSGYSNLERYLNGSLATGPSPSLQAPINFRIKQEKRSFD